MRTDSENKGIASIMKVNRSCTLIEEKIKDMERDPSRTASERASLTVDAEEAVKSLREALDTILHNSILDRMA